MSAAHPAHFVWYGPSLPWLYALAVRSAALRSGLSRVVLHHADELQRPDWWDRTLDVPGVELVALD